MNAADTIKAMRAAGIDDQKIVETMLVLEEERLAKARARQAKYRNNKRKGDVANATNVARRNAGSPPSSFPPIPPHITTPSPIPPSVPSEHYPPKTPLDELCAVLDRERAKAVVEHRQRLRKPLTQRAARLLAGKFAQCRDPNAGADAMIANGWQGFEPEWLDNRGARSTGPPRRDTATEVARVFDEMMQEAEQRNGN